MAAPAVPLTTPQMSPMTSLQKLDTRGALRIRRMDWRAPWIFRAAMEWEGGFLRSRHRHTDHVKHNTDKHNHKYNNECDDHACAFEQAA